MPGTLRTDETVFNVPRLGKNYLRAGQHRDVISILPNGCRGYEFHPWEKKLALVDTYLYTDVSIYDYLQRLEAEGENMADYTLKNSFIRQTIKLTCFLLNDSSRRKQHFFMAVMVNIVDHDKRQL
ncbi:MAG: hypothetical protein ACOC5G_04665 [Acidobacteriota bacterium]